MNPSPETLSDWLDYLERLHPKDIELGLCRTKTVMERLKLDFSLSQVITVAGTNGKGTTCAMVENACIQANKSVAVYSSPHLIDYRERVRINGNMLSEAAHCDAFAFVERARQTIPLTYFEFGTLAALYLMSLAKVEVLLLEVGLGGRLDAVNVVDPDLSVITTIDLDHQDWLGNSREEIALEKAGILRSNQKAIIGELSPPNSLLEKIAELSVDILFSERDFFIQSNENGMKWSSEQMQYSHLPEPHIPLYNVSTALAIISELRLNLSQDKIASVIQTTRVPGRLQQIHAAPLVLLDVAHNLQAVTYLHDQITKRQYRRLHIVCGMLEDKDIQGCLGVMQRLEAKWYLADIDHPRSAPASSLSGHLGEKVVAFEYDNITAAYSDALQSSDRDDLILVFGSFFTVSAVLAID